MAGAATVVSQGGVLKRFLGVLLLLCCWASVAQARKIVIIQATKVELRPSVDTPDGRIEEYIVIVGNPAIIKVDEDEITADRIEYNKSTRKLRIVGAGIFQGKNDTIAGRDFEVDLESEGLTAADVLIATKELDVQGISCERLPGQVNVQNGYFSPCSRCGTRQDAYGFKAKELTLYPGDRLVARDVTIMLAGVPVMYLPIVVVFLSEPSRYPKLELNLDATSSPDRPTVGLDLPFTIGDNGFGYWLLRYYAARSPAFGLGFDMNFSNPFGIFSKARASLMMLPPRSGTELQWAYRFSLDDARIPLLGREPEDRWADLLLNISLVRGDTDAARELRQFAGENLQTKFDFSLKWSAQRFDINTQTFRDPFLSADLNINYLWVHRAEQDKINQPYRFELNFKAEKLLLPSLGAFRISSWSWSAGWYSKAVNTANPSATLSLNPDPLEAIKQNNFRAFRFSLAAAVALEQSLWTGGRIFGSADFRGRYYSSRNASDPLAPLVFDGDFERNIEFNSSAGVQQTIGTWFELGVNSTYQVARGESPFADEQARSQSGGGNLNGTLNLRPLPWLSLSSNQVYGFTVDFRNEISSIGKLDPFSVALTINPKPINLVLTGKYNFETNQAIAYTVALSSSAGSASFGLNFGYTFATPEQTAQFQDLNLTLGYTSSNRAVTVSLGVVQNLLDANIKSANLGSSLILGSRENPVTLTMNQTLTPALATTPGRLGGVFGLRYNFPSSELERPFFSGLTVSLTNSFDDLPFKPIALAVPSSSLSLQASFSGDMTLAFTFSSRLDLATLKAYEPTLTARFDTLRGASFEFGIELSLRLPDTNSREFIWSNLTLRFGWDLRPGISTFADLTYQRSLDRNTGIFTDVFSVRSLGVAFGVAVAGSERPNLFFVASLSQNFTFKDSQGFIAQAMQPSFNLIYDQCCYALIFSLKPNNSNVSPAEYVFSFTLSLPYGKQSILLIDNKDGVRLPVLPFIPAFKP